MTIQSHEPPRGLSRHVLDRFLSITKNNVAILKVILAAMYTIQISAVLARVDLTANPFHCSLNNIESLNPHKTRRLRGLQSLSAKALRVVRIRFLAGSGRAARGTRPTLAAALAPNRRTTSSSTAPSTATSTATSTASSTASTRIAVTRSCICDSLRCRAGTAPALNCNDLIVQ